MSTKAKDRRENAPVPRRSQAHRANASHPQNQPAPPAPPAHASAAASSVEEQRAERDRRHERREKARAKKEANRASKRSRRAASAAPPRAEQQGGEGQEEGEEAGGPGPSSSAAGASAAAAAGVGERRSSVGRKLKGRKRKSSEIDLDIDHQEEGEEQEEQQQQQQEHEAAAPRRVRKSKRAKMSDGGASGPKGDEGQEGQTNAAAAAASGAVNDEPPAAAAASPLDEEVRGMSGMFRRHLRDPFGGGGGSSRWSQMLKSLRSADSQAQSLALSELCNQLLMGSEELVMSLPLEEFVPLLIELLENKDGGKNTGVDEAVALELAMALGDEAQHFNLQFGNDDANRMLMASRCLYQVIDVLPPAITLVVNSGGVPVMCNKLNQTPYEDLIDSVLSLLGKIADEQPMAILKAGGVEAMLKYVDFFPSLAIHRTVVTAVARQLHYIPSRDVYVNQVKPSISSLTNLLVHDDPQVLQHAGECWVSVVDNIVDLYGPHEVTMPDEPPPPKISSALRASMLSGAAPPERKGSPPPAAAAAAAAAAPASSSGGDKDKKDEAPQEKGSGELVAKVFAEMGEGPLSRLLDVISKGLAGEVGDLSTVLWGSYCVSVMTHYSDQVAARALAQEPKNLAIILRDFFQADGAEGVLMLRVLCLAASMLPMLYYNPQWEAAPSPGSDRQRWPRGGSARHRQRALVLDYSRMEVIRAYWPHIEQLMKTLLPRLVSINVSQMAGSSATQSLAVSMLVVCVTCLSHCVQPDLACALRGPQSSHKESADGWTVVGGENGHMDISQAREVLECMDATELSSFMAGLLTSSTSPTTILAALSVVLEVLTIDYDAFAQPFVRHGLIAAIYKLTGEPRRARQDAKTHTGPADHDLHRMIGATADAVLEQYVAEMVAENKNLKQLQTITTKLKRDSRSCPAIQQSTDDEADNDGDVTMGVAGGSGAQSLSDHLSPEEMEAAMASVVAPARPKMMMPVSAPPVDTSYLSSAKEALSKLQHLLLAEDLSPYEFLHTGTAQALCSFLFGGVVRSEHTDMATDDHDKSGGDDNGSALLRDRQEAFRRLYLFLDTLAHKGDTTALMRLVQLCVRSISRAERLPVRIYWQIADADASLPAHLRPPSAQDAKRRRAELMLGQSEGSGHHREFSHHVYRYLNSGGRPRTTDREDRNPYANPLTLLRSLKEPLRANLSPIEHKPDNGDKKSSPPFPRPAVPPASGRLIPSSFLRPKEGAPREGGDGGGDDAGDKDKGGKKDGGDDKEKDKAPSSWLTNFGFPPFGCTGSRDKSDNRDKPDRDGKDKKDKGDKKEAQDHQPKVPPSRSVAAKAAAAPPSGPSGIPPPPSGWDREEGGDRDRPSIFHSLMDRRMQRSKDDERRDRDRERSRMIALMDRVDRERSLMYERMSMEPSSMLAYERERMMDRDRDRERFEMAMAYGMGPPRPAAGRRMRGPDGLELFESGVHIDATTTVAYLEDYVRRTIIARTPAANRREDPNSSAAAFRSARAYYDMPPSMAARLGAKKAMAGGKKEGDRDPDEASWERMRQMRDMIKRSAAGREDHPPSEMPPQPGPPPPMSTEDFTSEEGSPVSRAAMDEGRREGAAAASGGDGDGSGARDNDGDVEMARAEAMDEAGGPPAEGAEFMDDDYDYEDEVEERPPEDVMYERSRFEPDYDEEDDEDEDDFGHRPPHAIDAGMDYAAEEPHPDEESPTSPPPHRRVEGGIGDEYMDMMDSWGDDDARPGPAPPETEPADHPMEGDEAMGGDGQGDKPDAAGSPAAAAAAAAGAGGPPMSRSARRREKKKRAQQNKAGSPAAGSPTAPTPSASPAPPEPPAAAAAAAAAAAQPPQAPTRPERPEDLSKNMSIQLFLNNVPLSSNIPVLEAVLKYGTASPIPKQYQQPDDVSVFPGGRRGISITVAPRASGRGAKEQEGESSGPTVRFYVGGDEGSLTPQETDKADGEKDSGAPAMLVRPWGGPHQQFTYRVLLREKKGGSDKQEGEGEGDKKDKKTASASADEPLQLHDDLTRAPESIVTSEAAKLVRGHLETLHRMRFIRGLSCPSGMASDAEIDESLRNRKRKAGEGKDDTADAKGISIKTSSSSLVDSGGSGGAVEGQEGPEGEEDKDAGGAAGNRKKKNKSKKKKKKSKKQQQEAAAHEDGADKDRAFSSGDTSPAAQQTSEAAAAVPVDSTDAPGPDQPVPTESADGLAAPSAAAAAADGGDDEPEEVSFNLPPPEDPLKTNEDLAAVVQLLMGLHNCVWAIKRLQQLYTGVALGGNTYVLADNGYGNGEGNGLAPMMTDTSPVPSPTASMSRLSTGRFERDRALSQSQTTFGDRIGLTDAFCSPSLSSKVLRQLTDPLAVIGNQIPTWISRLAVACPYLFFFEARRRLLYLTGMGSKRSMHFFHRWLSDAAEIEVRRGGQGAGGAGSNDNMPSPPPSPSESGDDLRADREAEGQGGAGSGTANATKGADTALMMMMGLGPYGGRMSRKRQKDILNQIKEHTTLPRQKVRIGRTPIIENAWKVFECVRSQRHRVEPVLEVEYYNESGSGLGPTLEFYALVAQAFKDSTSPRLFLEPPNGLLFPQAYHVDFQKVAPTLLAKPKKDTRANGPAGSAFASRSGLLRAGRAHNSSEWTAPERDERHPLERTFESKLYKHFKLLGMLVAKSLTDQRLMDLRLHPVFWRLVLSDAAREVDVKRQRPGGGGHFPILCPFTDEPNKDEEEDEKKGMEARVTLSYEADIMQVSPSFYNQLQKMKEMKAQGFDLEQLCVIFTVPGPEPLYELRDGGRDMVVTRDTLDEYLQLVGRAMLYSGIALQVHAFREGFELFLPLEALLSFQPVELATQLIAGGDAADNQYWTLDHLKTYIKPAHGYQRDSAPFRYLLEVLSELSPKERRLFCQFATGAPALPLEGFGALKPLLTVVVKETPSPQSPDRNLPSVMTCTNYLKLPRFTSKDVMRERLLVAINEGQGSFLLS